MGIDLFQSPGGSSIGPVSGSISGSTIRNLDEGLAALTDYYNGANSNITKSFFVNNATDVVFYPWGNQNFGATVNATIRCNSFSSDANSAVSDPIGTGLKDMAVITRGLGVSLNGNELQAAQWSNKRSWLNSHPSTSANEANYMSFSTRANEVVFLLFRALVVYNPRCGLIKVL